jgi:hypothetical protein
MSCGRAHWKAHVLAGLFPLSPECPNLIHIVCPHDELKDRAGPPCAQPRFLGQKVLDVSNDLDVPILALHAEVPALIGGIQREVYDLGNFRLVEQCRRRLCIEVGGVGVQLHLVEGPLPGSRPNRPTPDSRKLRMQQRLAQPKQNQGLKPDGVFRQIRKQRLRKVHIQIPGPIKMWMGRIGHRTVHTGQRASVRELDDQVATGESWGILHPLNVALLPAIALDATLRTCQIRSKSLPACPHGMSVAPKVQ